MPTPFEQWYLEIPVVTRIYITAVSLVTVALQLGWVSWLQLYFNYELVFYKGQYWRLITTFLYFGNFSLDWLFNMYFAVRYSRDLEEGSFINRPADFAWLLILVCTTLLLISAIIDISFLGTPLNFTLTYIWSRQYPYMVISFLGLFTFTAPYLPWVMAAFTSLLGNRWPVSDLVGIAVGHIFWFLEDEWPRRPESSGFRALSAPRVLCRLFNQDIPEENMEVDNEIEPPVLNTAITGAGEPDAGADNTQNGVDPGTPSPVYTTNVADDTGSVTSSNVKPNGLSNSSKEGANDIAKSILDERTSTAATIRNLDEKKEAVSTAIANNNVNKDSDTSLLHRRAGYTRSTEESPESDSNIVNR